MAIRTTTTRTTSFVFAPFADSAATPFSLSELLQAYYDCRKHKRNTHSALGFEFNLESNIVQLMDELLSGTYQPGKSICFVVTRPKAREVWAADFRDRIVHHLLYNKISSRFENSFLADSCACIKGRGTLYAGQRLESKIRSITQNWSVPAFYLKCDLANFFVSIDKTVLLNLLRKKINEHWWMDLAEKVLMHDPRTNYITHSSEKFFNLVPPHKRLANQSANLGLPIGNLSSQFFANIYLNELDQFVKHQLHVKHYIRHFRKWKTYDRSLIDLANIQLIENYMRTVLQNLDCKEKLRELRYCAHDKDCGYRSALRFFGLAQTEETDEVAHSVIYGTGKPKKESVIPMQLGFSW